MVLLITLVALFLPWHACLILKIDFYVTGNSSKSYSVGGLQPWYGEKEAFEDSHFMPQAVRGGLTDHTGSIVSSMACMFDLKNRFLCNRKLIKIVLCRRATAMVW